MKTLSNYILEKLIIHKNSKIKETNLSQKYIRELTSYGYEELPRVGNYTDMTPPKQLARLICINHSSGLDEDLYRRLHQYTDTDKEDSDLEEFLIKFIEKNT